MIAKKVAYFSIIVIIVVCCNKDVIRSSNMANGTVDIEYIDNKLSEIMERDFERLLYLIFTDMKAKGYIRDDLTYSFTGNPEMAQFYNMFAQFVLNRVMYIGQTEPKLANGMFKKVNVENEGNYNPGETKEIIEEIVNKKKEDMIKRVLIKMTEKGD